MPSGEIEFLKSVHKNWQAKSLQTDKDSKTPLHIAAQNFHKLNSSFFIELWLFLVVDCKIDGSAEDSKGKTAYFYLPKDILKLITIEQDKAKAMLDARSTVSGFQQVASSIGPKQTVVASIDTNENSLSETDNQHVFEQECTEEYVHKRVERLLHKPWEYFLDSTNEIDTEKMQPVMPCHKQQVHQQLASKLPKQAAHYPKYQKLPFKPESKSTKWEVEILDSVQKQLETMNPVQKKKVFKTIQKLARGYFSSEDKKIKESKSSVVFETRINKADRLLYTLLDRFSEADTKRARYLTKKEIYVYKKKIIVLDIVLRHKGISHHAERVLAIIDQQTRENELESMLGKGHQHSSKLPQISLYCTETNLTQDEIKKINENALELPEEGRKEVDIGTKTYSLSRLTVLGLLSKEHERCEYPIKVTDDEFDIINKPESTPVVVLGRSGTGKTTTCLCRLWRKFIDYWDCAERIDDPQIPRDHLPKQSINESDVEQITEEPQVSTESTSSELPRSFDTDPHNVSSDQSATHNEASDQNAPHNEASDQSATQNEASDQNEETAEETEEVTHENDKEHLHQIFITKSSKLCNQLRRKFCDYIADHEPASNHLVVNQIDRIPSAFSEVDELCFPLFLTARQFFLMVDKSISDDDDKEEFFHENDVVVNIDNPDASSLFQINTEGDKKQRQRIEVTASYFQAHIWKKICKKERKLDPLLIWTEIQSFIKGSTEALKSEGGILPEVDYTELGIKKAPNFPLSRSKVYKLFKAYSNLKHTDIQQDMFDNGDFIYHIYKRLQDKGHSGKWSIDYVYIDEVQDFTQAELSVIVRCCKDPNGFFFAGDTAQTIIKGVAFRFEDLTSIFHLMQKSSEQLIINVPKKPYLLTLNHRSHRGITSLATTVTDLLREFFPRSFDWQGIPKDWSRIDGPIPLFLCSGSLMEYFLILQDKSVSGLMAVEFGADQAVIVRDEEARKLCLSP